MRKHGVSVFGQARVSARGGEGTRAMFRTTIQPNGPICVKVKEVQGIRTGKAMHIWRPWPQSVRASRSWIPATQLDRKDANPKR